MRWLGVLVALCVVTAAPVADTRADVRLPAVLSDNLVLQRETDVTLWGWAEPGETVTVRSEAFKGEGDTTAGADGRWKLKLATGPAGGPFRVTIAGRNTRVLENVLVGEVWLCAGQSNMEWTVGPVIGAGVENHAEEIRQADHPRLRLFTVARSEADAPREDCAGAWQVCAPETVASFSGTAYFFGLRLHEELKIPVGVVCSAWGGTPIEYWLSDAALRAVSDPAAPTAAADKPAVEGKESRHSGSRLYNGMIAPLTSYTIRGFTWYQGESNVGRAEQYRVAFPALIRSWRSAWGDAEAPFFFVQIAPFDYQALGDQAAGRAAELREAQALALRLPHTGMVVTTDIVDDVRDIHPPKKRIVGDRLARWALAKTYGRSEVAYSGPLYRAMQVEGDKVRITFEHVGGGLVARGGTLTDFSSAGADRKFVPAQARIDGDTLIVSAPSVPVPAAVRFGWSDTARPNLFNAAGLPAAPFRTDDWPAGQRMD